MPAPEQDYRFQTAQLWRRVARNDRYANPLVRSREELKVRWESTDAQIIGPNGQPISLDVMAVVLCDVEIGSMMWLGCAGDLPDSGVPTSDIMEVISFKNTPDDKGRFYRKVAGLKRFTDKFPVINNTV